MKNEIIVKGARSHNLQNIDVSIPKNSFTVITGISGSGKSSLVFDTIFREGQRRYLESFSGYARQFLGKIGSSETESITGLQAAISIDQKTTTSSPRSTVGTLTEIYDLLRLFYARLGNLPPQFSKVKLERSLFSFNSPLGACPTCKGLGVQDRIDPALLIGDENRTIREGAFVMTTPSGYIVYSQVTMDVLNDVCQAHDFNVDIPWVDLSAEQKEIILRGSTKLKVPFGKHTLESRLKWSGITAKPREEGFYTGILTIMEDILKRDRNGNILRFARSVPCPACLASRLRPEALAVTFHKKNIAELSELSFKDLGLFFKNLKLMGKEKQVATVIINDINQRLKILSQLGLDYLSLNRGSTTLSGGEAQRIRLAGQTLGGLQNVLYVLDEPSIGLHPLHNKALLKTLRNLQQQGNSLLVVEHDEEFIRQSDYLVDIGPKAGTEGGQLIYSGTTMDFFRQSLPQSITWELFANKQNLAGLSYNRRGTKESISISGARENNLKNLDVKFKLGCLNVVCGVSGSGKSSLVENILARHLRSKLHRSKDIPGKFDTIEGISFIDKVINIDQSAIGRTPRSNPATYTKLFESIRELFAEQDLAIKRGWKKSRFSFNTKGGRCEVCQGAGVLEIGMHFLDNIAVTCSHCNGKRFTNETLQVRYQNKSIFQILELTVDEALNFFSEHKKISRFLTTLKQVGLGYITLGQPSTTLSGGEAQRIKLAAELSRPGSGKTIYILDEPTTGLHLYDVKHLLNALHKLIDAGNTVIIIEHHEEIIFSADYLVELGPGSGKSGGEIIFSGSPSNMLSDSNSVYNRSLTKKMPPVSRETNKVFDSIVLKNVSTNNLKNISLQIPHNKLTVITGVSGSGKSSLAFDTIFSEGHRRFTESLSTYARRFLKNVPKPDAEEISGISPPIAINQRNQNRSSRSTVGTFSEISGFLRLLFSRVTSSRCPCCKTLSNALICPLCGKQLQRPLSNEFSFNNEAGACPDCNGLSTRLLPDPEKIITLPKKSIMNGALDGTKTGKFYGERFGQYLAILETVGNIYDLDFKKPWNELTNKEKEVVMYGCGAEKFDVIWKFKRKTREGVHKFNTHWLGFCGYIQEEYDRKHLDNRGLAMLPLFTEHKCNSCDGSGLKQSSLQFTFAGKNIHELSSLELHELVHFLNQIFKNPNLYKFNDASRLIIRKILPQIMAKSNELIDLGLEYLSLSRKIVTLSGGELQRLRLASYICGSLTGITYILDEPTVGLHPRDTRKLISCLKKLAQSNTVIIVEHDRDIILAGEHIVELGPYAGKYGGELLFIGGIENFKKTTQTGKYLMKAAASVLPKKSFNNFLEIYGARANNLKKIDIRIPVNCITAISGVSGSGKTSLLHEVIFPTLQNKKPVNSSKITGLELVSEAVLVDQSPVSKSSVSTPATFIKALDIIRKIFAVLETSKSRGYKPSHFSYLNKEAQCPICKGRGTIKISMDFLSDIETECEGCHGKRYNDEVLEIKLEGRSIYDVLELSIASAVLFFEKDKKLHNILSTLDDIGLGYLKLGQPLSTISGGEAQRLKLAKALLESKHKSGSVYLLDEPTTGLHFIDITNLQKILRKLCSTGNTVVVVEHNTDIISQADWVIDLGPEGGNKGGNLVTETHPVNLKNVQKSITGKFL